MGKSNSVLGFKPIARPKYKEEISGEEAPEHQTWEIMMMVRPSELSDHTYPVFYYMRAAIPEQAAFMAHELWSNWEKKEKGLEFHKYPDIEEVGAGHRISEKDFQDKWRHALASGDFRYKGMRENPSDFTYGLRNRDNLGAKPRIIVPHDYKG